MATPSYELIESILGCALQSLGMKMQDEVVPGNTEPLQPQDSTISSIDSDIQLVSSLIRLLAARHAKLRRQRNHVASATRKLPLEVFQDIIRQSLTDWPERSDPARLETLRTVCTSWSENILADRQAWAVVHFTYAKKSSQMDSLLERSGNAALRIVVGDDPKILERVLPHVARLRYLEVPQPTRDVKRLLRTPMPQLHSLILGNAWHYQMAGFARFTGLFSGVAPNLRYIRSSYAPIVATLHPSILQNFTELSLIIRPSDGQPTPRPLPCLSQIISSCANLQSLELWVTTSIIDLSPPSELLTLPYLQSLKLTMYASLLEGFVEHIQGPQPRICSLHPLDGSSVNLQSILRTAASFLKGAGPLNVRVTKDTLTLQVVNGGDTVVDIAVPVYAWGSRLFEGTASCETLPPIVRAELFFTDMAAWYRWGALPLPESIEEIAFKFEGPRVLVEGLGAVIGRNYSALPPSLRLLQLWESGEWVDKLDEVGTYFAQIEQR